MNYGHAKLLVNFQTIDVIVLTCCKIIQENLEFIVSFILDARCYLLSNGYYFLLKVRISPLVLVLGLPHDLAVLVDDALVEERLQLLPRLHQRQPELIAHEFHLALARIQPFGGLAGEHFALLSENGLLLDVSQLLLLRLVALLQLFILVLVLHAASNHRRLEVDEALDGGDLGVEVELIVVVNLLDLFRSTDPVIISVAAPALLEQNGSFALLFGVPLPIRMNILPVFRARTEAHLRVARALRHIRLLLLHALQ